MICSAYPLDIQCAQSNPGIGVEQSSSPSPAQPLCRRITSRAVIGTTGVAYQQPFGRVPQSSRARLRETCSKLKQRLIDGGIGSKGVERMNEFRNLPTRHGGSIYGHLFYLCTTARLGCCLNWYPRMRLGYTVVDRRVGFEPSHHSVPTLTVSDVVGLGAVP